MTPVTAGQNPELRHPRQLVTGNPSPPPAGTGQPGLDGTAIVAAPGAHGADCGRGIPHPRM